MNHLDLKPMQGSSVKEKTAVTMKSIKELLEEEAARRTQTPQPLPVQPQLKATVTPIVEAEKTVPPMPLPDMPQPAAAAPKAESFPEIEPLASKSDQAEKPRSFLGRLIGS